MKRKLSEKFIVLAVAISVMNGLDAATTKYAINHTTGGDISFEANPLARYAMEQIGIEWTFIIKIVYVTVLLLFAWWARERTNKTGKKIIDIACFIVLFLLSMVVGSNTGMSIFF